jgi:hypothetical protein
MAVQAGKPIARPEETARIIPDPLSAVLPAFSALGAIASIASVHWIGERSEGGHGRVRRKTAVVLRDLENDCLRLQEIFKRLYRAMRVIGEERSISAAPFKFGLSAVRSDGDTQRFILSSLDDTGRVLASVGTNAFEVVCAIEDGHIEAPESVFFAFGEMQERLNRQLAGRASVKALVDTGLDTAVKLTGLVIDLKRHVRA